MKLRIVFSPIALVAAMVAPNFAQHTFSIVAIDTLTGEIGSAGATCGDSIIWPGTPGAYIISDILPGVGAIHTQSYWNETNQKNAHKKMEEGLGAIEIINWLRENDTQNDPTLRQYGAVSFLSGAIETAAFTGSNCMDYKNHITGPNYAIQGNILIGKKVLENMESGFNNTSGSLATKLMAAMQGANMVGADARCTSEGTSSLSSFIRVAKPTDQNDKLYLDINVAGTGKNVEPIDVLQTKFNAWALKNSITQSSTTPFELLLSYNTSGVHIACTKEVHGFSIYNQQGKLIHKNKKPGKTFALNTSGWTPGMYFLVCDAGKFPISKKLIIN